MIRLLAIMSLYLAMLLVWTGAGVFMLLAFASCGKFVQVCPTGALFVKGKTVAEMRKDRGFLKYIVTAREKGQWIR